MVAGELELLEECRAIVERTGSLTPEDDRDDDVLTFVVVESELDHVPYPSARPYWYPVALAEKDQQAASYIARMRDEMLRACRSLIVKWGAAERSATRTMYDATCMRLRARVRAVTGSTSHGQGAVEGDLVVRGRRLDAPCWIEIQRGDDGYFLLYLDAAQQCITDTWHASIEDAKAQAAFEFATEEQEWEVLST